MRSLTARTGSPADPGTIDSGYASWIDARPTPFELPYEHYNVVFDLDDNPRWFFAMNLHVDRGVFAGSTRSTATRCTATSRTSCSAPSRSSLPLPPTR